LLNCGYSLSFAIMIHNGDDCIMYNYDFTTKVGFEKKQLLATHSLLKQVELEPLCENYDL